MKEERVKRTVVLLLVVLLAFASTSVFAGGEKEAAKGDKLLVGTSVFSTEIEYFKILDDCYKKAAAARGMDIISTDGEDSVDKQIHIIEDLIARGVDGIVISAVNPNAERAILEEAMAAGIPVLLQGQERVEADWPTANVGYSEWDMGYMAGELVAEKINKIYSDKSVVKVGILGFPQWPSCIRRADAHIQALKDNVKGPKIEVVINQEGGTRQNGLKVIETALQANPDLRCVVSINDDGAIGAVAAFEAAGIDVVKDCCIAGCNNDRAARPYIREGKLLGSVDLNHQGLADAAMDALIAYKKGEKIPEMIYVKMHKVTKENIDQFDW
jgi:ribose transport system substrate-binding protein